MKNRLMIVHIKLYQKQKKIIENAGLKANVSGSSEQLVSEQMPKPGTKLDTSAIVKLYTQGNESRVSSTVPDLKGMTFYQAKNALNSKNLNINSTGKRKSNFSRSNKWYIC